MTRLSEELIEEVRSKTDIVDLMGNMYNLQKEGKTGLDFALFMEKVRLHSQLLKINNFFIALDVVPAVMLLHL